MAVVFTNSEVAATTHDRVTILVDYTGDLSREVSNINSLNFLQVWYFRPSGGSWQGYSGGNLGAAWSNLRELIATSTVPRTIEITSTPDVQSIYRIRLQTLPQLASYGDAPLNPETSYDFWFGIIDFSSGTAGFPQRYGVVPNNPPTGNGRGYAILASTTGSFTTTRRQGLVLVRQDVQKYRNDYVFNVTELVGDNRLYGRWARLGGEFTEAIPIPTPSAGQYAISAGNDRLPLVPNRRYRAEFSQYPDFNPSLPYIFDTEDIEIPGIIDPTLTFDQAADDIRAIMRLDSFNIATGDLPAGYIETTHINADAPDVVIPHSRDDTRFMISVADFGKELARIAVAGSFELSDGSWEMVSQRLWEDRPVVAQLSSPKYLIEDTTLRNELREQLSTSTVVFQVYSGVVQDNLGNPTNETRARINATQDRRKAALQERKELNQTALFVRITEMTGWNDANIALLSEDIPNVYIIDVVALVSDALTSSELNNIEPSLNIEFQLTNDLGVVTYIGTVISKRVFGQNGRDLPTHRLTVWVHSSVLESLRFELVWEGQPLLWEGNELRWSS